ncbi:unnamed protein product [Ilex paraguariensis]|uniref:DNA mismatch repair protein n=1 Tax=Ilex paraguariensis TaxID=185542 RepID=A0ABC8UPT9_9AQUA
MASSRRSSNGRSPLVNQQRQITSFYSKTTLSSPSPLPSPVLSKQASKPNPSPSTSSSPTTPSPLQTKRKKPLLVISPSPPSPSSPASDTAKKLYGKEVVDKRIRVYWPLDKTWYEGFVKSFDKISGKHLVQYDDAEEELLDLGEEKVEWVGEPVNKFRRLRRLSMVEDDVDKEEEKRSVEDVESGGGDSADEDWEKNAEKEEVEDVSEDMDLEDEEEDNEVEGGKKMAASRKRKVIGGANLGSRKKSKSVGDVKKSTSKVSLHINGGKPREATNIIDCGKASLVVNSVLVCDAAERFGIRESEKFRFLREDRRDANKKRPEDVGYDPKTLYIPPDFLKRLTGGQRQWWEFKAKHMDKVLFFKMGKFYELFEMDAHIGAKELDLQYMKVVCGKASLVVNSVLVCDAAERFGIRESEKFRFLREDRRDANKKRPEDVGYDPKTLYIPPDFLKRLTGGQRQWWEFKAKHMDKVLFFKMGKFYELFEMDAHIGAKELDLQYMKGEQPHCGFPEKNFSMNVEKLARKGYRVLIVEQTETPEQLELRRKENGSKDKVVKREICAVVTRGTLTEGEMLSANPDASYLMAVTENCQISENQQEERIFGVCVVDVATSKIILGQFGDDSECSALCCLLSELRPVEIIKPAKLLSLETDRILMRHTRSPLVNELVPLLEFWDAEKTVNEVKGVYTRLNDQSVSSSLKDASSFAIDSSGRDGGAEYLPKILCELVNAGKSGSYALSALGGVLFYLKQAFLNETLLRFAKFELLPCSGFSHITRKPYMVLDAAALENLEIFENSRNGDSSGTVYAQLNHCMTAFGKRLLKTWLARPLYHLGSIRERQDAVASLKGVNLPSVLEFRKELSRLPDMERLLARIFASSEACGRNANKVVLYEDATKKQLQEFISALRGSELMIHACSSLAVILENVNSTLLYHLLTPGKGLPDVHSVLKPFKDAFDWVEANNSGRVIPREGVDMEYDSACKRVREVESNLTEHLKEQQILLGDASINYVTVGKDAYLLEVPEHLCRNIPRNYELRSSKKGFFRYWTPVIKKFIGELLQAESEKETMLKSILQRLVGRFCEHHKKWRQLVLTIAELDVLMSLAIASDYYEGPTSRPKFSDLSSLDEVPYLTAKSLGHPVLRSDTLGKGAFVPNDVTIGGCSCASFILLTGPNMGGKSTLLRQVCLAVILAQVGADVPAESFELSPVDRIFVRMGAKDHIMAGQSTFLTELVETASMLSSATHNSLVALDELGRGTSTSDGQAIAESVLEHFVQRVQCRGLFSTHYHRLAVDYQKDPKVSLCHMACQVGKGIGSVEEVTFLYRLTLGACPKSYGVNVARLAGLPDTVLQKAAAKSREFEEMYGKNEKNTLKKLPEQSWEDKMIILQNLINVIVSINCHETAAESAVASSLINLQRRTRILLERN